METMKDFLREVKTRYKVTFDYRLAQLLGVTRQNMSQYKTGRIKHFSEKTAYQIARLLHQDPEEILLALAMERTEDKEVKEAWGRILKRISKHAAAAVYAVVLITETAKVGTLYIMSNIFGRFHGMKFA